MFSIVLNRNNIVSDGLNNKMVFKFPNSVNFKNNFIAVSSVAMYYSWYNISSPLQNNTFSYSWTDSLNVINTFTITIPNGIYEISDLNKLIQFECIKNGTYWITNGINYYPFEFLLNINRYAIQINTYLIPTVSPVGTTQVPAPIGMAPGWPLNTNNSIITIPNKLNSLLGFSANPLITNFNFNNAYIPPVSNFISKNTLGTLSYISDISPQVQPNGSLYISISNINNPYTQPSSIIYAINPSVGIGEQILDRPPNFSWSKLIDGTYNELRLTFLGSDLQPISIADPNMTIILVIKDGSEYSGK